MTSVVIILFVSYLNPSTSSVDGELSEVFQSIDKKERTREFSQGHARLERDICSKSLRISPVTRKQKRAQKINNPS